MGCILQMQQNPFHKEQSMKLVDLIDFEPHNVIFCRGCEQGRYAKGAKRDEDSKGDIYCAQCISSGKAK